MRKWPKKLVLILVFGIMFNWIESLLSRGLISGSLIGMEVGDMTIGYWTLAGWSTLWMTLVGGICGLFADQMTEWRWSHKLPVFVVSLLGLLFVWAMELSTGAILNLWLKLGVWDYSSSPINLLGQISLTHGIGFFMLMPFALWLGDVIRFYMYEEEKPDKLLRYYLRLVTFKV